MFRFFKKKESKINLKKNEIHFGYKKEFLGILTFLFSIFILISLISYNPKDRSFLYYSSNSNPITNWAGFLGANFSAILFYFLGSASFFLLFFLIYISCQLVFKQNFKEEKLKTLFSFFTVFSMASIFSFLKLDFTKSFPGGVIGFALNKNLTYYLGDVGFLFFNFAIIFFTTIFLAQISFATILSKTYSLIKQAFWALLFYIKKGILFLFNKIVDKIFKKENKDSTDNQKDFAKDKDQDNFLNELESFIEQKVDIESTGTKDIIACKAIDTEEIFTKSSQGNIDDNLENLKKSIDYKLPNLSIFKVSPNIDYIKKEIEAESVKKAKLLEEKLEHFGIKGKVIAIKYGPVVTLFEYKPEIDSKISKIVGLEDDLAMALTALSIRILAPIPGKSVVGFEISNIVRQNVLISEVLQSPAFTKFDGQLPLVFGVDVIGIPCVQDLVKMPHLLVAGSTGSGKSVGLNVMLVGLLAKFRPDQLKVILIDPKRLEFAPYKDIPHLLFPIVTDPTNAAPVLKWLVGIMEKRYEIMANLGVKNIVDYQTLASEKKNNLEPMPFIVLMIDELADLMMVAGKDIEIYISRIAQMARAAGIHLVVATQRPSVEVLTGLIKVNMPSRISFRVSTKIDSRTILDCSGAEKLLGKGDMLYMSSASSELKRIHGAYVTDKEIETLVEFIKSQQTAQYLNLQEIISKNNDSAKDFNDELYPEILEFVKQNEEVSISMIQRQYRIGFNRSARIIEKLELDGIVASAQGSKPRKVLR